MTDSAETKPSPGPLAKPAASAPGDVPDRARDTGDGASDPPAPNQRPARTQAAPDGSPEDGPAGHERRSTQDAVRRAKIARIERAHRHEESLALPDDVPPEEAVEMPLPHNTRTVFQGGILFLLTLGGLYIAREVVLPVVLAIVLKLLLQPLVRLMERIRIPRAVGALISVLLLLGVLVGLGMLLSTPAANYAAQLPQQLPKLEERFSSLKAPIDRLQGALDQMGIRLGGQQGAEGGLRPASMVTAVFSGTGTVASTLLETLLILFYLLVFGETFLRRLVEVLPRFEDKKEAVAMSQQIESDLSTYLLTITVINAVVGLVVGGFMWLVGVPAPVIWGVVAFCLNYVPILGPFCGVVLFLAVGVLVKGAAWAALLPAGLYLGVHILEGEIITPMLLARRFTINPVAVMLSLVFWYWMWGVAGAVLAVPLLAITKIVCDRLRPLRALGHVLEG